MIGFLIAGAFLTIGGIVAIRPSDGIIKRIRGMWRNLLARYLDTLDDANNSGWIQ